ncbi:carboxypeptidase-like regulatory domain-containing protein, partial [Flavobacterium sp.]|uniref:carboxypeptidase-like regulatory domain-containing protein n=1 Tax=Flavobacterium sp. TaxID=239 RepID=UPI00391D4EE0
MKKLVFSALFVLQVVFVFAQSTGFTGKVVDSKTQKPLQNVVASIQNTTLTTLTNVSGVFTFNELSAGSQLLQIKSVGFKDQLLVVEVEVGKILDLGIIVLEEDITFEQQINLITILENDLGDDNSGSENTAGLLQASRDVFQQAAAFNWGQARFRIRGLDNEYSNTMINGVSMNKLLDNRPQWGNWGGLNDATRNQEFTMGSAPSDYTFGGILGTQEINTRASIYRKGTRLSYAGTQTNYNWRAMMTHASGMNKKGWAFVISASRRWAQEAYFEGTDYAANSLFASIEKKFNEKHSLNFTTIYAQNRRGRNSSNTNEITSIAGIKYNSFWGYQDGEKRNSRDREVEEPINMLTHYWKINDKTQLTSNVMYQFGKIGNSR